MSLTAHFHDGTDPERFKGHPYESKIEHVAIEHLVPLREYDREEKKGFTDLNALTENIRQHGVKEPLIMEYGQNDRRAYIGEGNHRLAAAVRLGLPALPVRVMRRRDTSGRGQPVPGIEPNQHDYVPGDLKPSQIGLPVWKDRRGA